MSDNVLPTGQPLLFKKKTYSINRVDSADKFGTNTLRCVKKEEDTLWC
jgi:hypothetical protein